jgi:hypothetical protein
MSNLDESGPSNEPSALTLDLTSAGLDYDPDTDSFFDVTPAHFNLGSQGGSEESEEHPEDADEGEDTGIVSAKAWVQIPPWQASFAGVSGRQGRRSEEQFTCYPPPRMNSLPDRQRIQTCNFRQEHHKGLFPTRHRE